MRAAVARSVAVAVGALALLVPSSALAEPVPAPESLQVLPESFRVTPSSTEAGQHEDLTTSFELVTSHGGRTVDDMRTVKVQLPAGFTGNNNAVPACPTSQLLGPVAEKGSECPPDTQVGTISFDLTLESTPVLVTFPLYNIEVATRGVTAQLGFNAIIFSQILDVTVRPGDAGLTVTVPDIENIGEIHDVSVTVWGVPWAKAHEAERGRQCYPEPLTAPTATCRGGNEPVIGEAKPFLRTPTSCSATPLTASIEIDSWEQPETWSSSSAEVAPSTSCERLPFSPTIEVQPTTQSAESPSGLAVSIEVPQNWEKPETLSTADLKDAKVTLPVGFTINPSAGSGLGACTPRQYEEESAESPVGVGCPPESKIGSIEIETPVLDEKLTGAIYVAKPFENPFGSLLSLYIVARAPERGILVKVAGEVHLDPTTGQLTTTFLNNPQQPFTKFTLQFRPGATAPLVSPPTCGSYTVDAALTPWSTPEQPHLLTASPFQITQGVGGGPCPSGGTPPFAPQAVAGTQNNAAGSSSPFYLRLERRDGEQELTGFSTIMPPGLTGNLTGIPFCPDAAIEAARARTGPHGGQEELASPSCPAASKVGHTIVEAGVGSVLAQTPGSLYLGGPYHGAPFSLVSITSAVVGPFDLGTVVVRFALQINPLTAQVEVSPTGSEPIPHIIKGIIVHVRTIRVYVDRPDFIKNPTSCDRMQLQNTVSGGGADPSNPADQSSVLVSSPFQAADCANLQFKPKFVASTSGKTSKADGASLHVDLTYPSAPQGTQANIKSVKVDLPKQLPSRLTTLQKACTAAQFDANPAGCPAASLIGTAKAITPILPVPLEGPVYFVSNGGEAFPNLIMVLQGYGVRIDLVGDTFISKNGVTSSTFKAVPDQPVTSFELTLPEKPYSALGTNKDLCALTKTVTVKKKVEVKRHGHVVRVHGHVLYKTKKVKRTEHETLLMPTKFVAQNGAEYKQTTHVSVTGCPPARAKAKHAKKGNGHKKGKAHK